MQSAFPRLFFLRSDWPDSPLSLKSKMRLPFLACSDAFLIGFAVSRMLDALPAAVRAGAGDGGNN